MTRKKNSARQDPNSQVSVAERCTEAAIVDPNYELYDVSVEHDEKAAAGTEKRKASRTPTDLEALVQFQFAPEETWKEHTQVLTVSKSGASFALTRSCDVGTLVELLMPLPAELRAYDLSEELYTVVGLVQYCHPDLTAGDKQKYSVGVAFVGKSFPEGHEENPTQNYHISGTTTSGMWQIKPSGSSFKVRAASRLWVPLPVTITRIKRDRASDNKEHAVTSNVSTSGAAVLCRLDLDIGDRIKFASKEHNFYSFGIVRNRKVEPGKVPVLHIEFVDHRFPVEKIAVPRVTAVTA